MWVINTKENQDLLIKIIASVLLERPLEEAVKNSITNEKILELYNLSKPQDLAHILHIALCRNNLLDNEFHASALLQRQEIMALYRYETMKYESDRIYNVLYKNNIPFVPLKGAYIRKFYPEEYMRTSCDVDVFVKKEHARRACQVICNELSYTETERSSHDIALHNQKGDFHVELHFSLIMGELDKADEFLENAWDYVDTSIDSSKGAKLTNEFFFTYFIAHTAKHFMHGGCGIRPFMDLYLIRKNMQFDENVLSLYLDKSGMTKFTKGAIELSQAWFGDKEHTNVSSTMQDFLFESGVYGSQENFVAMRKVQNKGLVNRLFLPYKQMKRFFPKLEKMPVLLPYYWGVRLVNVITSGRTMRTINEIQTTTSMSEDKVNAMKALCNELGME